jgi:rhodanese-related sulfurtransferase
MMNRTCFFAALFSAILCWGFAVQADDPPPAEPKTEELPQPTKDSLETVKNNLDLKKAILLDVREKEEWDEGRLKRARLVPFSKIQEGLKPDTFPKDKVIYLHCRSGRRSLIAQELLKKEGYDARSLKQGYEELLQAGFQKAE